MAQFPSSSSSGRWSVKQQRRSILNSDWSTIVDNGLVLLLDAKNTASYPGSGTTWYDLSPSKLNFTGSNAAFMSSTDGLSSGNTWSSPSTSILNNDSHSIFFSIRFNSTTTYQQGWSDGWEKIFSYNPSGSDRSPGVWRFPSNRRLHWRYDGANSDADFRETIDDDFALNVWYYVGVTKNGSTATMYVNGQQVRTSTVTNPKAAGNSPIYLFEAYPNASANIDNVQIYNRPITAAEVLRNYTAYQAQLATIPIGYLVVGGGGGGGMDMGGGGGAGGYLAGKTTLSEGSYFVSVGGGGVGAPAAGTGAQTSTHQFTIPATAGSDSILSGTPVGDLVAKGGGFGGSSYRAYTPGIAGGNGGSGGGSSGYNDNAGTFLGGTGTSGQGNRGGNSIAAYYSGGGGGAGGQGVDSTSQANGGAGIQNSILGTNHYWAGGGGGAGYSIEGGNGGAGGGGAGAVGSKTGGSGFSSGENTTGGTTGVHANVPGGNGGFATGGGGGGGAHYAANNKGGNGGSGSVIIRYSSYLPDLKVSPGLSFNRTVFRNYKIYHFFAGTGMFTVPGFVLTPDVPIEYLVAAGGAGGGSYVGGGGGGGGLVIGATHVNSTGALTLTVGGGGATNANGSNSSMTGIFCNISAIGGGTGANFPDNSGADGGSGGGHGGTSGNGSRGGTATQRTSVSRGYGTNGASSTSTRSSNPTMGGGGGGAGTKPANNSSLQPSDGGDGIYSAITGVGYYWCGGGGGGGFAPGDGASPARSGNGGAGGGGNGGCFGNGTVGTIGTGGINSATQTVFNAGANGQGNGGSGGANTGSGGGGCGHADIGGSGGSGIIVIAYPSTYPAISSIGAGLTYSVSTVSRSGYRVYTFTAGTGAVTF
jgi:hypothetical protein